jgi:hypothetical protein
MKVIIYNQDNGIPAVMTPSPECLKAYSIIEIAIKDVPAGKPFKIVDVSELPQDVPQEYWVIDDKDLNDGIGGESNEFEPSEVQNED